MMAVRTDSSLRLQEILQVLKRQNIVHGISPEKLKNILEDLGPVYVKIGQIMSMRSDVLPLSYCNELRKLHTQVRPMPFAQVEAQIMAAYGLEAKEIFNTIDPLPLGSASIAQVHKAELSDGRLVVIKVQRPQILDVIKKDIVLLHKAVRLLGIVVDTVNNIDLSTVIKEMWLTSQQETDFLTEAEHLKTFSNLNHNIAYVTFPQLEPSLTTPHVLVMEYIEGIPIDHLDDLEKAGYDINEIGEKLAENYIKQILDDGFFHADPHPGNVLIRNGQIVWLDLGMTGRLSNRDRTLFKQIAFAIIRKDVCELKDLLLTLGEAQRHLDHSKLYADLDSLLMKYATVDLAYLNFGGLLQKLLGLVEEHNITIPAHIAIMGRGLLTLEGLLTACCPDVNLLNILTNHLIGDWQKRFDLQGELGQLGISLPGILSKSLKLPAQISDILKMTLKGHAKVNLAINETEKPLREIGRMADRLILAFVDAALLISSGLLCTTDMEPRLWGVPLAGMLGYTLAAILGVWLCKGVFRKKPKK